MSSAIAQRLHQQIPNSELVRIATGGHFIQEDEPEQVAQASQPPMADLTMALNVSARQFHQSDFVAQVLAVIERTGANPKRLKLELTESLLVTDVGGIIVKMNTLKARGVDFSLSGAFGHRGRGGD